MANSQDWQELKMLENMARDHGFTIDVGHYNSNDLSLVATDDLAIYAKNISIAEGDSKKLLNFLYGWSAAIRWLTMLGVTDQKKIAKKVQDYKNAEIMEKLRTDAKSKTKSS